MLLAALLALSASSAAGAANVPALSPLHTEGEKIMNAAGEEVALRGTNFGGRGIMEDWFCPFTDPAGGDARCIGI